MDWIVSHAGVNIDNVKYVLGAVRNVLCAGLKLFAGLTLRPFLLAYFFTPSTVCTTYNQLGWK